MSNATLKSKEARAEDSEQRKPRPAGADDRPSWETPTMEDVSQQVMAQPYIRFT